MKFTIGLAFAAVASAIQVEVEAGPQDYAHPQQAQEFQGEAYFRNPGYQEPDYSKEYGEKLPGADFNKQVKQFSEDKNIWD